MARDRGLCLRGRRAGFPGRTQHEEEVRCQLWVYGAEQSISLQPSCALLPGQAPAGLGPSRAGAAGNRGFLTPGNVGCRLLLPSSVTLPWPVPPFCSQTSWAPGMPATGTAWPRIMQMDPGVPGEGVQGQEEQVMLLARDDAAVAFPQGLQPTPPWRGPKMESARTKQR